MAAQRKELMRFLRRLAAKATGGKETSITLDYPVHPVPRYGYGRPLHPGLTHVIEQSRAACRTSLESVASCKSDLWRIPESAWINGFLTALDAAALYALIRVHRPRLYIEIGSGHSTGFARRAVEDGRLDTTIVSIDPHPRHEVRNLAHRVIEQPVEEMALDIFEDLQSGDILFVDHSHRVFTNSDATVVFLDILPALKPGVLVHFHDIFLPADYPPEWNGRYYSEQYLLACCLLAPARNFEILLANSFVSGDPALRAILADLWRHPAMKGVETHGCSFWVRIKAD